MYKGNKLLKKSQETAQILAVLSWIALRRNGEKINRERLFLKGERRPAAVLGGKMAVCYPGYEKSLHGATIPDTNVVVDGNYITSKGPATSIAFGLQLVETLKGKETADRVASDTLFKKNA